MRFVSIGIAIIAAACNSGTAAGRCDDGLLCENVDWCAPGGGCEPPTQDCAGKVDGTNCEFGAELGRCIAGHCEAIPAACDGVEVDPGEMCDGEATACTALGFGFGTAPCRNCALDASGCNDVGWTKAGALPTGTHVRSIWADGGVVWIGAIEGLYKLEHGVVSTLESGPWPYVAGVRDGDVFAMSSTGELVLFPRGGAPTRRPITDVPRGLAVIDGDLFVGGTGYVYRASRGFAPEPVATGGDVRAFRKIDGALYAAGGAGAIGKLWRLAGDGTWESLAIDGAPPVYALSNTGSTIDLGVSLGWYRRELDGTVTPDDLFPGSRATAWAQGRFLYNPSGGLPVAAFVDGAGRIAPLDPPTTTFIAAASFDAAQRRLWIADQFGELQYHAGVDLKKVVQSGVVELERLGDGLSIAFDATGGTVPYMTTWVGDGLTATLPPVLPTITIATGGSLQPIQGAWSQDLHHHFVIRQSSTSSSILVYDTSTGVALPRFVGGPSNMRGFAGNGSDVIVVGVGGAARFTGLPGIQTWMPVTAGLPTDVELLAAAPTPTGFVSVGTKGQMFVTTPGVWSWDAIDTHTTADLRAVTVIGNEIIAVGSGGTVVHCIDRTCVQTSTGTTADLTDLDGITRNDLFAVGGGAVLQFDGQRWQSIRVDGLVPSSVAVGPSTVWFGERGGAALGLYQMLRISPL